MTAAEIAPAAIARQRVDRIKVGVETVWHLIVESYQARDWEALGYATWDEMCTREFGTSRLRLPREERAETIGSLRDAGLSVRAIESATGLGKSTVQRELAAVPFGTPAPVTASREWDETTDRYEVDTETGEMFAPDDWTPDEQPPVVDDTSFAPAPKVTGIDGKSYAPSRPTAPSAPRRKPLPDEFRGAVLDLGSKTERITRLSQDDRFNSNADQIRQIYLSDLIRARDALQRVIDQLA